MTVLTEQDVDVPAAASRDRPRSSRLARFARAWLLDVAGITAASGLLTVLLFRLWSMPLRVPLDYTGDGLAQLSVTKGIIETGWNVSNPALGAPTGYVSYDFPAGSDNLHWLGLKILGWFSHDAVLVTNLYFFAGFVMVAVVALVVLRLLGLPRWVAHPVALLFTFLPFHYGRGIAHLALGNYVSVPLGCLLVLWAAQGRPAFFEPGETGRLRLAWRTRRAAVAAVACVVLAIGGIYYAAFTIVLLAVGVLIGLLARADRAHVISAAAVVGLIAVVFALNTAPALRYQADHGHNPGVAVRNAWEVDNYPLRPIQLVTPTRQHPIGVLDRVGDKLREAPSNSEPTQELGTFGTIGLALALASLAAAAAGRRRLLGVDPTLGVLIVAAVLLGTVGGFSWILSNAGLAEIRSWNRISVLIGFFALYALGCAVAELARARLGARLTAPVAVGLAVALTAVGVWDEAPRGALPTTENFTAAWHADRRFVDDIAAVLAPDAMVFELPRISYPEEGPVDGEAPQEFFKPYLHSDDLRWSFGGMRGRESDWQEQVAPPVASTPDFLDAISAVGFAGVLVDREAYVDGGRGIEAELAALTVTPPMVSEAGDVAFYDLRRYAGEYRAEVGDRAVAVRAERELARPTMWWGAGFSFQERTPDLTVQHPGAPEATSVLVNHTDREWRGTVHFEVRSYLPGQYQLRLDVARSRGLGGPLIGIDDQWAEAELGVSLGPGERVNVHWSGDIPPVSVPGDPRTLAFSVRNVVFTES